MQNQFRIEHGSFAFYKNGKFQRYTEEIHVIVCNNIMVKFGFEEKTLIEHKNSLEKFYSKIGNYEIKLISLYEKDEETLRIINKIINFLSVEI